MKFYKDVNNDSGVISYEYSSDYILVQYKIGKPYLYTYKSAGSDNVETMKMLAETGDGLKAFIDRNVKDDFVKS